MWTVRAAMEGTDTSLWNRCTSIQIQNLCIYVQIYTRVIILTELRHLHRSVDFPHNMRGADDQRHDSAPGRCSWTSCEDVARSQPSAQHGRAGSASGRTPSHHNDDHGGRHHDRHTKRSRATTSTIVTDHRLKNDTARTASAVSNIIMCHRLKSDTVPTASATTTKGMCGRHLMTHHNGTVEETGAALTRVSLTGKTTPASRTPSYWRAQALQKKARS